MRAYEQIEEHVEELKKNPYKHRPLAEHSGKLWRLSNHCNVSAWRWSAGPKSLIAIWAAWFPHPQDKIIYSSKDIYLSIWRFVHYRWRYILKNNLISRGDDNVDSRRRKQKRRNPMDYNAARHMFDSQYEYLQSINLREITHRRIGGVGVRATLNSSLFQLITLKRKPLINHLTSKPRNGFLKCLPSSTILV